MGDYQGEAENPLFFSNSAFFFQDNILIAFLKKRFRKNQEKRIKS